MRLSNSTLAQLPPDIQRPAYDRGKIATGIVHFGPGAFFRAHIASYFDDLLATDPRWGICAVSLCSPDIRNTLNPQDNLYTLAVLDEPVRYRVIGALTQVLCATDQAEAVRRALASSATHLITLTITEKGYAGTGASAIRWIVEAHGLRRAVGLPALTVMSCDNLSGNGAYLRAAVLSEAHRADPSLAEWIAAEARFPSTMVDSITPASTAALRSAVAAAVGVADAWPVQREPFRQWAIDSLPSGMPDLASVGATVGIDVHGYEQQKLRLLNGPHSTLAWLGLLLGYETVADAMTDPALARFIEQLMRLEIAPTLSLESDGFITAVLDRFRNPRIRHQLDQIAIDSSQKLPHRLLGTVADALDAGRAHERLAAALAGWMRFATQAALSRHLLADPLDARIRAAAMSGVDSLLAIQQVFPPSMIENQPFRTAVTENYRLSRDPRGWLERCSFTGIRLTKAP